MRNGGRAKTAAGVTGGGLHKEPFEWSFSQAAAIGDHVERHASGHAKIFAGRALVQIAHLAQQVVFEHDLRAPRHIPVKLRDLRFRASRRGAQQIAKLLREHPVLPQECEVSEV